MARTNTRRMNAGRQEFFEQGRAQSLSDDPEIQALSWCWLCRSPIDYVADPHSTPDSHNLDHYKTVRDHPELQEDPSNWKHSHRACNQGRGASTPSQGLGQAMPDWW